MSDDAKRSVDDEAEAEAEVRDSVMRTSCAVMLCSALAAPLAWSSSALAADPPADVSARQRALFDKCTAMMMKITQLPQPVVARVQGAAAAAGCQLVSMCDLAVAVDHAKFGLSGINAGIFCTTPSVGVARNVPRKRAMELLLTGDLIDARTASAWGLVNRVVPAGELDAAVAALAEKIARKSASVVALGKRAFYAQVEQGMASAYDLAGETMACNMLDPDAAEGIDAFLAKRPPNWRA